MFSLSRFQVYILPRTFSVVVFSCFPFPFTRRETQNKNQIHYNRRGEIAKNDCIFENLSAGIKIFVYISSNHLSRHHEIYRKRKTCFNFRSI